MIFCIFLGFLDQCNQASTPIQFSPGSANGVFSRKSPPITSQSFNPMTNYATSLPSSIGRLTLGLASHYTAPSPIQEQEEINSPTSSGQIYINIFQYFINFHFLF